ncbi:MAG: hypothetical protein V4613_04365 [Bacteroidota bacterium]
MSDLELIEGYLTGNLSESNRQLVAERIQNEPPFAALVEDIRKTYKVLERQWLRKHVDLAAKQLLWQKVAIVAVVTVAIAAVLLFGGLKLLKPNQKNAESPVTEKVAEQKKSIDTIASHSNILSVSNSLPQSGSVGNQWTFSFVDVSPVRLPEFSAPQKDTFTAVDIESIFAEKDTQLFHVNSAKDIHLVCKGGTIIDIPAYSLVYQDGSVPKEKVTISVTEFLDYYNLWKHKVSTIANGKIIETGGSCYITAQSKGQEVTVDKGQNFTIAFPSKQDARMKTFIGEKGEGGEVTWQPDTMKKAAVNQIKRKSQVKVKGVDVSSSSESDNCDCKTTEYYFEKVISDEGFYRANSDRYTFNELKGQYNIESSFDTFSNIVSNDIKKLLDKGTKIRLRFGIDTAGGLKRFDYNFKTTKNLDKTLKATAEYVARTQSVNIPFKQGTNIIVNIDLIPKKRNVVGPLEKLDTTASKEVQINTNKKNLNIIVASQFGYINCDFFSSRKADTDIEIAVPTAAISVKIFFTNFNVAARCTGEGAKAVFGPAPGNEPLLIVGTLIKNKELLMCMKKGNSSDPLSLSLDSFVPFNADVLQSFLTGKTP